ncbi:G-protein coupled peptide receptor [Aureococcus anophagefferens]|nr:G-protein coupled peptide receptor [Aureococcus anophagefferens]
MGAAGSVADYETAEKNSDASAFPPAFAEVSKAVAEKKAAGAGDAELLAFAEAECASKALTVHLDKEYSASTGRGRLHVTASTTPAAPAAAPAAAARRRSPASGRRDLEASKVDWLSGVVVETNKKLLATPTQTFVVLTDGSQAAHRAFEVGKTLVKDDDTLTVMHVKSDKDYTEHEFKADTIMARYDSELTGFLPEKRRSSLLHVKDDKTTTKSFISEWVNGLKAEPDEGATPRRSHRMPNFLIVGFSGRKEPTRDPTVLGQVADLSLRTVACPRVIVKRAPTPGPKTITTFVVDHERCWTAYRLLLAIMKPEDKLRVVTLTEGTDNLAAAEALKAKYLAHLHERGYTGDAFAEHYAVDVLTKAAGVTAAKAIADIVDDERPEYVALATSPRPHRLRRGPPIRSYKGNIVMKG